MATASVESGSAALRKRCVCCGAQEGTDEEFAAPLRGEALDRTLCFHRFGGCCVRSRPDLKEARQILQELAGQGIWGDADVRCVFSYLNGQIACTDKDGAQVPSEQEAPLVTALRDKLRRGAVTEETELHRALPNGEVERTTVGAFLRRSHEP